MLIFSFNAPPIYNILNYFRYKTKKFTLFNEIFISNCRIVKKNNFYENSIKEGCRVKNKINKFIYFIFCVFLAFVHKSFAQEDYYSQKIEITRTKAVEDYVKSNLEVQDGITYTIVPRGLVISIATGVLFDEQKIDIKADSEKLLFKIGEIIKTIDKPCVVEGNALTQNECDEINNIELSIMRADNIVEFIIKNNHVLPEKIRAIGFGNMLPFNDNVSYTGKLNKRIDFVILNYEYER